MMKRKILAVTIPVVGCITVVGAGFSAWYFDTAASSSESSALNTHVTQKVDSMEGALSFTESNKDTVLNKKYLILDQGGMNNDVKTVGIMIADSAVNETVQNSRKYTFKVAFNGTSSNLTLNKIYDAHMELSVTVEIDLSDKLYQYVTLVGGASMKVSYTQTSGDTSENVAFTDADKNNIWTATYTLAANKLSYLATGDISSFEWTFEIDLSTSATLENSLFRYVDDKKPTSGTEYDDMVKALGLVSDPSEPGKKPAILSFDTTAKIDAVA